MSEIVPAHGSPFEAIKRMDGSVEFWTGRDLQPLVDYLRWEKFAEVIEKAKASLALVQGSEAAEYHFATWGSDGGRWGNQQLDDYRLTRFGAYLTAMAGDDTKEAVAHARVYFAVRTEQAESLTIGEGDELDLLDVFNTRMGQAIAVAKKERADKQAALAVLAIAAPKAEKWEEFLNAEGLIGMTELADLLKTNVVTLTGWFVKVGWFRKESSIHGGNRNMPRRPYQLSGHFEVKGETRNGRRFPTAYATALGLELVVDTWKLTDGGRTPFKASPAPLRAPEA